MDCHGHSGHHQLKMPLLGDVHPRKIINGEANKLREVRIQPTENTNDLAKRTPADGQDEVFVNKMEDDCSCYDEPNGELFTRSKVKQEGKVKALEDFGGKKYISKPIVLQKRPHVIVQSEISGMSQDGQFRSQLDSIQIRHFCPARRIIYEASHAVPTKMSCGLRRDDDREQKINPGHGLTPEVKRPAKHEKEPCCSII